MLSSISRAAAALVTFAVIMTCGLILLGCTLGTNGTPTAAGGQHATGNASLFRGGSCWAVWRPKPL